MTKDQIRETPRDRATRRVMRSIARRALLEPLPVVLEDGTSPLVVALPDDHIAEIEARVERMGGNANLVVAYPDHYIICDLRETIDELPEVVDVHPTSTIDMILLLLRDIPGRSATLRVGVPSLREVEELEYAF